MWSRAREGRPPAIYPNLCPGGWVPSLTHPPFAAGSAGFCARGLVSAICRVHLLTPGSRSPLRLDLVPRFCGGGWASEPGGTADAADAAQGKVEALQVISQRLGSIARLGLLQGAQLSATLFPVFGAHLRAQGRSPEPAASLGHRLTGDLDAFLFSFRGRRLPSALPVLWRMSSQDRQGLAEGGIGFTDG